MNLFKGIVSFGLAIIFCLFLAACGGGGSKPAPPAPLVLTTTSLPSGSVNTPYNGNLTATGGTGSYTWSIVSGTLPPGLTLNATTSFISGTPLQPFGSYSFTAQVKDGAGTTASGKVSLYIEGAPVISPTTLPNGAVGTPYTNPDKSPVQLSATGGLAPYTWCVLSTSGSCDPKQSQLPAGLTLNTTTGLISGTPTTPVAGSKVPIEVTDSEPIPATGAAAYNISILGITTTSLPAATIGIPYKTTMAASGGKGPYTWSIASGTLPAGLTLDPVTCTNSSKPCTISGTPSQAGPFPFTAQVTDSESPANTASASLSITVNLEYTNANFKGNYAFTFSGYKNGSLVVMAGAFIANGDGTFQVVPQSVLCGAIEPPSYTGCLDYNDGTGESGGNFPVPQFIVAASSNYSIGPNGLGTMTLVTDQGNTFNFQVSIISDGSGTLIENNADPKERGSGVIKVQTPSTFNTNSLNATFAVGFSGTDNVNLRYAGAGVFRIINNGDIDCTNFGPNGCPADVDDGGTPLPGTLFRGTFSTTIDTSVGRGNFADLTFNSDHGDVYAYAYYIVNGNDMIMVSTNPISSLKPFPLTLWSVRRELTSALGWDNAALSATSPSATSAVIQAGALDTSAAADVTAGLLAGQGVTGHTCQGNNFDPATFSFDENQGGATQQQSSTGTFCIDKITGRVTLQGFSPPDGVTTSVFYMIASNTGFAVGTDPAVTSGYFEPQTGSNFSLISIFGTYSGGTINPVVSAVTDSVTWLYADGNGNINGTQDTSGPGGPGTNTFTWTYTVPPPNNPGRAVVSNNGSETAIMYIVSPTKVVMLPVLNPDGTPDTNPALSVLKSAPGS